MEIYRRLSIIIFLLTFFFIRSLQAWAFDLEGKINVASPWPKVQEIEVKKDQGSCGHSQASQALLISEKGDLKNAVVWLEGVENKNSTTSSSPMMDQKKCHFEPHILLVPQGRHFLIGNSDPMGHDVRAFDGSHMLFRFETEPNSKPVEQKFEQPGRFVLRCGLHPWMHAYVISIDHDYYSVSDADGKFYLKDVPKGNYTLRIWHEQLGETQVPIQLSESILDFLYTFPSMLHEQK